MYMLVYIQCMVFRMFKDLRSSCVSLHCHMFSESLFNDLRWNRTSFSVHIFRPFSNFQNATAFSSSSDAWAGWNTLSSVRKVVRLPLDSFRTYPYSSQPKDRPPTAMYIRFVSFGEFKRQDSDPRLTILMGLSVPWETACDGATLRFSSRLYQRNNVE